MADVPTDVEALRAEMAALAATVGRLRDANESLRREVADLRGAATSTVGVPGRQGPDRDTPTAGADRRTFLRGGAIAAGVVASGVASSVVGASPAAADTGDLLVLGAVDTNIAQAPTGIAADVEDTEGQFGFVVGNGTLDGMDYLSPALVGDAANSPFAVGVQGLARVANGVGVAGIGDADGGTGIFAQGAANGLQAVSLNGVGVDAAGSLAMRVSGGDMTMYLEGPDLSPPLDDGKHTAGEVLSARTEAGTATLWFCVEDGTPGVWRQIAGPRTIGGLTLLSSAARVYDSRPGNPPDNEPKTKLTGGEARNIAMVTEGPITPAGTSAVLVNLTVVNTSAGGFVALHGGGTTWPGNSTINWTAANTVIATTAIVPIGNGNQIAATCAPGASTDLIVDLIGYFI